MVKLFFTFLLLFSLSLAETTKEEDLLTLKIKSFIEVSVYNENKAYINIIFSPKSDYYTKERIDSVKIVQTLKENGLLNLFFKKPQELKLSFKTNGSPLFFVKIMGDTLRNIGYYRYVTRASNLDTSEFTWGISLSSEYATDPFVLQKELQKSGCEIVDIQRNSPTEWTYMIDMSDGHLSFETLEAETELSLKRSLYAHWLNVSKIQKLKISSSNRNDWYPYIAYYDSSLHLLKVIKRDEKTRHLTLNIPLDTYYIKISDIYTLKNVKDELLLNQSGAR